MNHRRELVLSISCLLLAFLLTMTRTQQQDENMAAKISPEILRPHVLVNSNSNEGQKLRLEVKSLLINTINEGLPTDAGKGETCTRIKEYQSNLEQTAEAYMKQTGYSYPAAVALANCYFPAKAYGNAVLPYGNYDAAKVAIRSGWRRSWWCVLYPWLCFINTSYGVVPETSEELLRSVLMQEEYLAIPDSRNERLRVEVHLRILNVMKDMIKKK